MSTGGEEERWSFETFGEIVPLGTGKRCGVSTLAVGKRDCRVCCVPFSAKALEEAKWKLLVYPPIVFA
jgi:hypothetical protein